MATGWLIENDLLVTAGHCAFDWSHNYGRLTHVKAYIGYTGKEAVKNTSVVQLRMGARVAAPESWLAKGASDSRGDVAFIRLNKPFTGVTPFKYLPTPMSGANEAIGVVGYPGDLMKHSTGEKGAVKHPTKI
jgi:V8-like Glu-specific endopeptidase